MYSKSAVWTLSLPLSSPLSLRKLFLRPFPCYHLVGACGGPLDVACFVRREETGPLLT